MFRPRGVFFIFGFALISTAACATQIVDEVSPSPDDSRKAPAEPAGPDASDGNDRRDDASLPPALDATPDAKAPAHDAGVDATDAANDGQDAVSTNDGAANDGAANDAGLPDADAATDSATATCMATLAVTTMVKSSAACELNEAVTTSGPAQLHYPCTGGSATAAFGAQTFSGTVTAGVINLTNNEAFSFGGCTWESVQHIQGPIATGTLTYTYSEHVVSGSCSGTGACAAHGTITAH